MLALTAWTFFVATLADSTPYMQGSECQSRSLLQSKASKSLHRDLRVGNSSATDIIDQAGEICSHASNALQVDLCLESWLSMASNDSSKLYLLSKIRMGEIYKVLQMKQIPFSALPATWPEHSVAEANAIIMTGEEAAVTLVSHAFEEEVELWLQHFNSTNATSLKHLLESVRVYLHMCGGDEHVAEFTRRIQEYGSLPTWNQSDAETMAFLLNYVENQCQLETMNLDILVQEGTSNHSCSHMLGLATTAVRHARAKRALRFEKLSDGSVYAGSLRRDDYCSAHFKLVEQKPEHWISKSNWAPRISISFSNVC